MKDFIKIFIVLCVCVGAFMYGRNYGETTFRETADYKNLIKSQEELSFTKSELENIKTKFQNIADGSENRKQEELLGQILQVFLVDLGLQVSKPEAFTKANLKIEAVNPLPAKKIEAIVAENHNEEAHVKPGKTFDYRRLKSYEWILQNSRDGNELKKNLNNVEIKDLNSFLSGAKAATVKQLEPIYGTYRGRITDINNAEYGSLAIVINPITKGDGQILKGSIKIFKNQQESMSNSFETEQLGFVGEGSSGFVINSRDRFFQIYKITETQQLTGYFYERMINGTTKKIGTFVLNRTDQF
ncbi:MAG: hypothetical protein WA160_07765 [Pseudobdellovibrio sp.]